MGRTVLVIDDDYFTRKLLDLLLTQDGFTVYQAENIYQALDTLRENPIDVITCDVMMPDMDGIAFLESIKNSPECAHIPVIIITATGRNEIIERAKLLGAYRVVEKPFTADIVREAIRSAR
jgi:CheY-like chemotaxis protein